MAFDSNIRCMSDCVILEGETQRDVCKQRCAGIDPMNMPKQKDCGTIYKQCVNACATDVGCKSECRQAKTELHIGNFSYLDSAAFNSNSIQERRGIMRP